MAAPVTTYAGFQSLKTILKEDPTQKEKFDSYLNQSTWESYTSEAPWKYCKEMDMVAVELFGEEVFKLNLNAWMLRETLGIGPGGYCVFVHSAYTFNSKMKLLLSSLPKEKMFFYPAGAKLRGDFSKGPWFSKIRAIRARPSISYDAYNESFCKTKNQKIAHNDGKAEK